MTHLLPNSLAGLPICIAAWLPHSFAGLPAASLGQNSASRVNEVILLLHLAASLVLGLLGGQQILPLLELRGIRQVSFEVGARAEGVRCDCLFDIFQELHQPRLLLLGFGLQSLEPRACLLRRHSWWDAELRKVRGD